VSPEGRRLRALRRSQAAPELACRRGGNADPGRPMDRGDGRGSISLEARSRRQNEANARDRRNEKPGTQGRHPMIFHLCFFTHCLLNAYWAEFVMDG